MANVKDKKFGKLTVMSFYGKNNRRELLWMCLCECGNSCIVKTYNLTHFKTTSCGCKSTGPERDDSIIGKKFGKLKVFSYAKSDNKRSSFYNCVCDCGNKKIVRARNLINNKTKTCGCKTGYKEIPGTVFGNILRNCKRKTKTIKCDISIIELNDLWNKQEGKCALTGLPLYLHSKSIKCTASLDRINSSGNYTKDNIQWVHKIVNRMKWDMDQKDFLNWCKLIYKYGEKNVNS